MEKDLMPIYEKSVKSYYSKAKTTEHLNLKNENVISLYSYNTLVSYIVRNKAHITKNKNHLSNTTLRHIKEFLKQNGFKVENKKQILNDYERF